MLLFIEINKFDSFKQTHTKKNITKQDSSHLTLSIRSRGIFKWNWKIMRIVNWMTKHYDWDSSHRNFDEIIFLFILMTNQEEISRIPRKAVNTRQRGKWMKICCSMKEREIIIKYIKHKFMTLSSHSVMSICLKWNSWGKLFFCGFAFSYEFFHIEKIFY